MIGTRNRRLCIGTNDWEVEHEIRTWNMRLGIETCDWNFEQEIGYQALFFGTCYCVSKPDVDS